MQKARIERRDGRSSTALRTDDSREGGGLNVQNGDMRTDPARHFSERLILTRMSEDFLKQSLRATDSSRVRSGETPAADEWLAEKWLIRQRLSQYRTDPAYRAWGVWAIGLRSMGRMIGHIGFHTPPNAPYLHPFAENAVEFGFAIYPAFRRQGLGTEAATVLMDWAFTTHAITRFVLSISPRNAPTRRIAEKLGFHRIGQWEDPQDGPEDVFLLDRAEHE
jgi:ribosomal-protein-alanine N-acetyltransferase